MSSSTRLFSTALFLLVGGIMDQRKIGKFIAELRKSKKLTQQQLAQKLYVDRTTVSKWELGQNTISVEMLLQIAYVFDVSINELIIGQKQNICKEDENILF